MNDKPLEFDITKMPRAQHIEIIDLEDGSINTQSNQNGINKNEESSQFRRDRDRKHKANRYRYKIKNDYNYMFA